MRLVAFAPDMDTLSRGDAGRYFVSFKTEVEIKPLASTGRVVGVDLGAFAAALSCSRVHSAQRPSGSRSVVFGPSLPRIAEVPCDQQQIP